MIFSTSPQETVETLPVSAQVIVALIAAITPITLAIIAVIRKPRDEGETAKEVAARTSVEAQYGVSTSDLSIELVKILASQDARLSEASDRVDRQDRRIAEQDAKILLLEQREDALLLYIEDIKRGAEADIYPPWPPIPH